jgi:hypothetical protein
MIKIVFIVVVCTFVVALVIGALFLILIVLNQPENETDYLEEFLDVCIPNAKNKELAGRELDMLKPKISRERYNKLCFKFYDKFKAE